MQMNQTENNVYDKLLHYLSHEGELTWEKFKDAVNRIVDKQWRYNPSTYLQSLARLGHLDYDPLNLSRVVIAPAVLVDTAVENQYVLVGSRTSAFLKEIKRCVTETGGKLQSIPEGYASTTIVLSDLAEASITKMESLGIYISYAFSAKLSKRLPIPIRAGYPKSEVLLSDSSKLFNLMTLKYEPNIRHRGNGLYEIPKYGPGLYILKFGSDQRRVPRDWGEWLVLSNAGRTSGFVSYVKKNKTLCVKYPLHLPLIIDRCATLCSGFPPKKKGNFYHYSDVPTGVAYQITKSLHQNWEVI